MQNPPGGKTALGLDTNVGALLCYLPVCLISVIYSIIVLVTDKESRFMRFHAFQSLLLSGVYIVVVIALQIFSAVVVGVTGSSVLAALLGLIMLVAIVAFLGAMIYGMIKGYQGEQFKFPVVGDMAEKWANS
jgi:uncharacterized membrane protein